MVAAVRAILDRHRENDGHGGADEDCVEEDGGEGHFHDSHIRSKIMGSMQNACSEVNTFVLNPRIHSQLFADGLMPWLVSQERNSSKIHRRDGTNRRPRTSGVNMWGPCLTVARRN
jgi:hypothetical protein